MKTLPSAVLLLVCTALSFAADDPPKKPAADAAKKSGEDVVFREPFTLKLPVDKEHFYEQKFDKIPYVHEGTVYLFNSDAFGVVLDIKDDAIRSVKYQPDLKKADVTFKFTQEIQDDGKVITLLVTRNGTKHALKMDGEMTVPGRKGVAKTNFLPIQAGLSSYESWPHPIVQLSLGNIRIEK